jgi:hypothetical protein
LGDKTREKARGHLVTPESTGRSCSNGGLRREIWAAWQRSFAKKLRGNGEEEKGFYRPGRELETVRE